MDDAVVRSLKDRQVGFHDWIGDLTMGWTLPLDACPVEFADHCVEQLNRRYYRRLDLELAERDMHADLAKRGAFVARRPADVQVAGAPPPPMRLGLGVAGLRGPADGVSVLDATRAEAASRDNPYRGGGRPSRGNRTLDAGQEMRGDET